MNRQLTFNVQNKTATGSHAIMISVRLLLLLCFTALFSTNAEAARHCFCDAIGCSSGDGVLIPASQCDFINGRPTNGTTTIDDLQNHLTTNDYGNYNDLPEWIDISGPETDDPADVNVQTGPSYLELLLKKNDKELADLRNKINELKSLINPLRDAMHHRLPDKSYDEKLAERQKRVDFIKNQLQIRDANIKRRKELEAKLEKEKGLDLSVKKNRDLLKSTLAEKEELEDAARKQKRYSLDIKTNERQLEQLKNMSEAEQQKMDKDHEQYKKIKAKVEELEARKYKLEHQSLKLYLTNEQLREQLKGKHQAKDGPAPDADRYTDLKNIRIYGDGSGSYYNDKRGRTNSQGRSYGINLGTDIRLGERFSIAPGLGYNRGNSNDVGGGGSSTSGYSAQIGFFWGPFESENIWFDGSTGYSRGKVRTTGVGTLGQPTVWNNYNTSGGSVGLGLNTLIRVDRSLQLDGRVGWNGTWSTRHASTDSMKILNSKTNSYFHRITAGGRMTSRYDWGEIYGSATVRYIPGDTSSANQDAKPWDGDLGAGVKYNISDRIVLSCHVGGIVGRSSYQEYNGSLKLEANF